jgi:hypothetical protein
MIAAAILPRRINRSWAVAQSSRLAAQPGADGIPITTREPRFAVISFADKMLEHFSVTKWRSPVFIRRVATYQRPAGSLLRRDRGWA